MLYTVQESGFDYFATDNSSCPLVKKKISVSAAQLYMKFVSWVVRTVQLYWHGDMANLRHLFTKHNSNVYGYPALSLGVCWGTSTIPSTKHSIIYLFFSKCTLIENKSDNLVMLCNQKLLFEKFKIKELSKRIFRIHWLNLLSSITVVK